MARCNGCDGKFGANGDPEVEIESIEIDDDGNINASVTITVPCANCGDELKTGMLELEHQFDVDGHEYECGFHVDELGDIEPLADGASDEEKDAYHAAVEAAGGRSFEIMNESAEAEEDFRPRNKTLKSGKVVPVPARYQTHYYGAAVTAMVRCGLCDGDTEVSFSDDMSASSLEEVG